MKLKYYKRNQLSTDEEAKYGVTYCSSLYDLLSSSDVVSLNCPLNDKTTGLISKTEFDAMKDGVFLINTARGAVIGEEAFKAALESGKIERAGLDVFCNEPKVDPYFLNNEQVVVQPHVGGWTDVAFHKSEKECFENIRAYFETGKPNSPVREVKARI